MTTPHVPRWHGDRAWTPPAVSYLYAVRWLDQDRTERVRWFNNGQASQVFAERREADGLRPQWVRLPIDPELWQYRKPNGRWSRRQSMARRLREAREAPPEFHI